MLVRCIAACLLLLASTGAGSAQSPPPARDLLTRIAFGSCASQDLPQPIWAAIMAYRPELFIFTGDNVYGDIVDNKTVGDDLVLQAMAGAYAKSETLPGYSALRKEVPHLAVWDDHDYGKNDGGADFVHKDAAQKLFADFWKLAPDDPRRTRPGLYHAHTFGPAGKRVQVILLDTRYFRSPLKPTDQRGAKGRERYVPDDSPDKTMLGAAQWAWLEGVLREPAEVRLIVSSVQALADGHGYERWGNLPRERQRLLELIGKTQGRSIVLSGDRHIGAIYKSELPGGDALHDITASGLTHAFAGADEIGPNRIGPLFGAPNFGTVDIDWWANAITLAVRSVNGEPVRVLRIDLGTGR